MGPRKHNNTNAPIPPDDRWNILQSELNNPAIEPVVKKYADLRYQLMPYTYTLAWEARASGLPLMRALWLHYPNDARARTVRDQFLWGRDLLIAPVYEKGAASRNIYLPNGDWYDWWTGAKVTGGQSMVRPVALGTMPIYVRAGAVIPVDPVRQYTSEPVNEPTTLRVYTGADGAYTLYEDDGSSQDYLRGHGTWIRLTWSDGAKQLVMEPGPQRGARDVVIPRQFTVQLLPTATTKTLRYEGRRLLVTF